MGNMTLPTEPIPAAAALPASPVSGAGRAWAWVKHRHNVFVFVGGFLFDVVTLKRIDSWLDLGFQLAYLFFLALLLLGQHREAFGFSPRGFFGKAWAYNVEALHFFYGGLLSNYVVFYAKSATGSRPVVFFLLLVALLFLNEMPQIRRFGHRLRLGLYAFCVASFLIYFVPVIAGRMGDGIFAVSMAGACLVLWWITEMLSRPVEEARRRRYQLALAWPAAAVLALLAVLYALRLVPPVPLSVKFQGVYHDMQKVDGAYVMKAEKPPFYLFWRRDSRPFRARPGDKACYVARIFAPTRFHHQVVIHWEQKDPATGRFLDRGKAPVSITGGREQGYRAYSFYENIPAGTWRAGVETEDGRAVGRLSFRVKEDKSPPDAPRRWIETRM
jgi:hypothetical protein